MYRICADNGRPCGPALTQELDEMKIWVDGDACPVVIKEILFKAAERTGVHLTLVANRPVRIPSLPCLSFVQVASGLDVADNEIVKRFFSHPL